MGTGVGNRGICPLPCRRPPRMITGVSIQPGSRCFVHLPSPTLLPHLYSARASLPHGRTMTRDAHHQKSPERASCTVSLLPWPCPSPILSSYVLIVSLGISRPHPRPILFLPVTCLSTFPDVQHNLASLAVSFSWAPPGNILKH